MKWSGLLWLCLVRRQEKLLFHVITYSEGLSLLLNVDFLCLGKIQIATKAASKRSFPSSTLLIRRYANRTESAVVLSPTPVCLLPLQLWKDTNGPLVPPPLPRNPRLHCFKLAVLCWPKGRPSEGLLSPGADKLALEMVNSGSGDCLKKWTASSLPGAAQRLDTLAVARRSVSQLSAVLVGLFGRASCRPAQPDWRWLQFAATTPISD